MQQATLTVQGMSCNHCVNSIESALNTLGVSGKVDLAAGSVSIQYEESQVTLDAIKEAIEEQGYDVV
ncbi:copper chaperone [Paenibacillus sp. UNCCL117]|uniref:copper ion binding protein n=1 Tax=unclassified Paenibacillus TaxID=185978 RepID=UPI000882A6E7|nr:MULTISPECIES: copper ion binding protein [unclassified Paenibacillus]SDE37773.1 copper chaperone [Paenibacillus sp. cl123]SFW64995.1 copper chaperone [Paenibacillus sp. UNCCL117]